MKKTSAISHTLGIYWNHARRYKRQFYLMYPLMVVAQILEDFIEPLIISWILTQLAAGNIDAIKDVGMLTIFGAIVAIEIVANIIWYNVVILHWRNQDRIMRDLFMTCFDHLQKLSTGFFANRFAGSLVSQVNKFVASYERLTDALTWNVFKLLVSVIGTTIIIGQRSMPIALAILAMSAVFIPLVWMYRRKQVPYNKRWAQAETKRTGQLADTISNIGAVKSFANEKLERARMYKRANNVYNRSMDTMRINMHQEFIMGLVQRSIIVAVIVIAVYSAVDGKMDIGTVYLALTFTIAILQRLWNLNNTFRDFTTVFGDTYDMSQILRITPEVRDTSAAKSLSATTGKIELKDVTFAHESADNDALFTNLSLVIQPGEKVGLVGHSGSGKTTLTNLLLRFMDIDSGQILVDGQDIAKVSQASLREAIAYVPQEPLLFHRSLAENITYGHREATTEDIISAAKKANAHEFIEKLKDGYETLVGERGVKLSGGQRQRVAIARAMIKQSPILILDEATSALDSESESLIQDALWRLMKDKTAIVIAHRLSTVQKLDRIIVLDNGKIVEDGSHNELIAKNGTYAKLWAHQSGGFLED